MSSWSVGLAFIMGVSLAYAGNPMPIPPTYLGLDTLSTSGFSTSSACVEVDNVECGGEFTGTLGTGTGNVSPIPINFWCVDSQEDFSLGQTGLAQVVELSNISGDSANVQYSGVTNGSTGSYWTNQTIALPSSLGGPITLSGSATVRYEMAAYLITQFPQYPNTVDNSNEEVAIEGAIWDIMSNTPSAESQFDYFPTPGVTPGVDDVDYWIYQASMASNYQSVANEFAVVSWNANSDGAGLSTAGAQTFLVQLDGPVPEPAYFGVLGVGFAGLFFVLRRRNKA